MDYDWLGHGLLLKFDHGTVFLQGDEASELHDQLEACEDEEQIGLILGDYSDLVESDDD
jgi:hypothetical protein